MQFKRIVSEGISETFSILQKFQKPKFGHRALMYHSIGGQTIRDNYKIFDVSTKLFKDHIKYLKNEVELEFIKFNETRLSSNINQVSITFDDGYLDNLMNAAPILERYSIPFTIFVTTDFIKNGHNSFLRPADLRTLTSIPGVSVGSHGASHVPLSSCNNKKLKHELKDSKSYLEDIIGKPIDSISYPNGMINLRVRKMVEKEGYLTGGTSYIGYNKNGCDPLMLSRISILGIDKLRSFRQKLKGAWDWQKHIQSFK